MVHRGTSLVAMALLAAAGPVTAQDGASVAAAVASITPEDVKARVNLLAADSMRGRYTPSPELEKAADYIASQFRSFGLQPGGEGGSFLQRYSVDQVRLDTAASSVTISGGPTWRFGREVLFPGGALRDVEATGPLVVVSGVPNAEAARRLDLAGTVVLLAPSATRRLRAPEAYDVQTALLARGPAAILVLAMTPDSAWATVGAHQGRGMTRYSWEPPTAPLVWVRNQAAASLLGERGLDLDAVRATGHPLAATRLDLRITLRLRTTLVSRARAPNVVGILEGGDPRLKGEYVVFSAHMDHLAVERPGRGDSINNGADDNASGTTAVIELAEAFAQLAPKPRRSLIFLTVSGEERGLWGSTAFTADPPVPTEQMVADFNLDMVGRNWKDTIVVIGRQHSDLGATLGRVNRAHPELGMTAIDDLWPDEQFFFRSDHYKFARLGVPALFFFNGVHQDYHKPSDEPGKIDAEKESRIVKLAFYLGLEVANAPARPKWNPASYRRIVEGR